MTLTRHPMICQRCGLEGAIDIDTGSKCHAEPSECIVLLRAEVARLELEVEADNERWRRLTLVSKEGEQ